MTAFPRLYRAAALASLATCAQGGLREAVAYLEEEVPRWKAENNCFSCHNNGDGARALFALRRLGVAVKPDSLADSLDNLRAPARWEAKTLAIVQYGAAMREASNARLLDPPKEAIATVLKFQEADGHWKVDEEKAEGAAATYGPELGTALALAAIGDADPQAASKARRWLASRKPQSIVAAAGVVMGGAPAQEAVALLLDRQVADGSWNHEAFDTAIAMLALKRAGKGDSAIARGRAYLLKTQLSGGGWAGTTRPAGGTSYAQHISTTAWAALALAVSDPAR